MTRLPPPIAAIATVTMHLLLVLAFFVVFTPLALLLRAFGLDLIGSRRDDRAGSYWRQRRNSR